MTYRIVYPAHKPRRFYSEAAGEYKKRLTRYCKVTRVNTITPAEGKELTVALSPDGTRITSEGMADRFLSAETGGIINRITFLLNKDISAHFDEMWALTTVNVPADLTITLLLEQIYRAQKIMHHEPYHK